MHVMKDPRVVEIEILSRLDRQTFVGTTETWMPKGTLGPEDRLAEEALLHLMFDGAVLGEDYVRNSYHQHPDPHPEPDIPLKLAAKKSVEGFLARQNLHLRITQRGRLRLYRLRDEVLNKDKLRDEFNVLWAKRHWQSDRDVTLLLHDFSTPFSILLLDVDRLKDINAAFLNSGADEILRGIFQILRGTVPADTAYGLGGDEAGVLLPGLSPEKAKSIAEEVRANVERTFASKKMPNGHTPTVSIGVGTASRRIGGDIFEQTIERARVEAKQERNRVVSVEVDPSDVVETTGT